MPFVNHAVRLWTRARAALQTSLYAKIGKRTVPHCTNAGNRSKSAPHELAIVALNGLCGVVRLGQMQASIFRKTVDDRHSGYRPCDCAGVGKARL